MSFSEKVYWIVRQIPKGRVTSYGAIAKSIGAARSSRMVGYAMNASHTMKDIPAHRVVNRNGLLTGKLHFSTPHEMQAMLEEEGVLVENNQVTHFQDLLWDPMTEVDLENAPW